MDEIFETVSSHLHELGIECELIKVPPTELVKVLKAEKKIGLPIPDSLKKLYTEYANGLVFHWSHGDDFGSLHIPNLTDLVSNRRAWAKLVLWKDEYEFPHVQDPELAKQTNSRMKSWLPLIAEGNGDCFCLDCGVRGGPVVFDQHDWFDGGSGENGHRIAPSLTSFVARWGSVCFTWPKGCYWPSTFIRHGVSWTSRHFKKEYIIPR
jgi:hypothetical protein